MFQKGITIFEEFRQKSFDYYGEINPHLGEIGNKLYQLQWLINYASKLNSEIIQSIDNSLDNSKIFELEIITESFYHFAWRIIEISKNVKDIDEIERTKVGQVRNQLLVHPEKQKNRAKIHLSFSVGGKLGPKIKGYIGPSDSVNDEGLFENAEEFNERLCRLFIKEIEKIKNHT